MPLVCSDEDGIIATIVDGNLVILFDEKISHVEMIYCKPYLRDIIRTWGFNRVGVILAVDVQDNLYIIDATHLDKQQIHLSCLSMAIMCALTIKLRIFLLKQMLKKILYSN